MTETLFRSKPISGKTENVLMFQFRFDIKRLGGACEIVVNEEMGREEVFWVNAVVVENGAMKLIFLDHLVLIYDIKSLPISCWATSVFK